MQLWETICVEEIPCCSWKGARGVGDCKMQWDGLQTKLMDFVRRCSLRINIMSHCTDVVSRGSPSHLLVTNEQAWKMLEAWNQYCQEITSLNSDWGWPFAWYKGPNEMGHQSRCWSCGGILLLLNSSRRRLDHAKGGGRWTLFFLIYFYQGYSTANGNWPS